MDEIQEESKLKNDLDTTLQSDCLKNSSGKDMELLDNAITMDKEKTSNVFLNAMTQSCSQNETILIPCKWAFKNYRFEIEAELAKVKILAG